ncbi:inositol monophosphatase family protein [Erysipelothrix tonsillarum]|uniref:inositol monophosphatase family protein n=1 Tax=Erysipelothrix tonsillarum TaxID=38402 RepID=UPI000375F76D|nr:inositol monophosphatase family protein [Erysipelothrix tonsillarum]
MQSKLAFAKELVYEAGEYVREHMKEDLNIDTKSARNDFVTNVDKGTEQFLVDKINAAYSAQNFITEEKMVESKGLDNLWIIDPIDGTSNFIFEKRNFAISVGYYEDQAPVFGIVYDVSRDEMYVGVEGEGAYLNDVKLPMLPQEKSLDDAVVYSDTKTLDVMFGDAVQANDAFMSVRYMGAASLEICGVAAGRHQVYLSRRLKVWDIAAATIILRAVGGAFTYDTCDNKIILKDQNYEFMCAVNPTVIQELKDRR